MPSSRKKTPKPSSTLRQKTKPTTRKKLPYSGPKDPEFDGHGRIRKWSSTCRDGLDLKTYIEYGCADGLTLAMLREKFPQFQKYNPSTFSSAVQNCKKGMNAQVHNRRQVACEYFYLIFVLLQSFLTNHYFSKLSQSVVLKRTRVKMVMVMMMRMGF